MTVKKFTNIDLSLTLNSQVLPLPESNTEGFQTIGCIINYRLLKIVESVNWPETILVAMAIGNHGNKLLKTSAYSTWTCLSVT